MHLAKITNFKSHTCHGDVKEELFFQVFSL